MASPPTIEQAQLIITQHAEPNGCSQALSIELLDYPNYGRVPGTSDYLIRLQERSYILSTTSAPDSPESKSSSYHPNTLSTIQHLHTLVEQSTSLPIPTLHTLDTSQSLYPQLYILYSLPSSSHPLISLAQATGSLTEVQQTRINLQIGTYLAQLHTIQNDWFDLPLPASQSPRDPSYSWQDSFTLLLENLLDSAPHGLSDQELGDLRKVLSKAIGSFVFDDVEVPSLIWWTGSEEDIFVDVHGDAGITLILPRLGRAVWGDPAMETLLREPVDKARVEGYGGSLVVFQRQRTKRVWYDLTLALVELTGEQGRRGDWAKEEVKKCTSLLKSAPCY